MKGCDGGEQNPTVSQHDTQLTPDALVALHEPDPPPQNLMMKTDTAQAMDYAIAHGLKWVEAGAQGPHKVQRGYLPRQTYSAHWIADPGLKRAVERFLADERRSMEMEMRMISARSPFRKGGNQGG